MSVAKYDVMISARICSGLNISGLYQLPFDPTIPCSHKWPSVGLNVLADGAAAWCQCGRVSQVALIPT